MTATFVTFYSFKGGVGRSQALANTAVALANRGLRVIAVDMDLESPGLHSFFEHEAGGAIAPQDGVLEYLEASFELPEDAPQVTRSLIPCTHIRRTPSTGSLRMLLAGQLLQDYERRLSAFSWETFYRERDGYRFMELFRDQLGEASADFVLIDSRTGLNDTGQICTFQLPDVVVALFALHSQGIEGTRKLAAAVRRCREEEGEAGRPRRLLLVPSRVDEAAPEELRERWLTEARRAFDGTHELLADLHERIPYVPQVAFGEHVVIGGARSILSEAYERLVDRILGGAAEAAALRLDEIRALLHDVERELRRGPEERAMPSSTSLRDLRRWLSAESERREAILGRIDRARRALEHVRAGGGPDGFDVGPATRLDTEADMAAEAERAGAAVRAIDQWIGDRCELVRDRLLAAADSDEEVVAGYLPALYEAISAGGWLEVDSRVTELQEALSRESLPALLRQGRLSVEQHRQTRPSASERVQWLDQMIERTLNDPASSTTDPSPVLRNLLVLVQAEDAAPTLFHWMAYEQLCGGSPDHVALFAEIGHRLWQADWSRLLGEPTGAQIDMDHPVGVEGRRQIEQLAREHAPLLAPLAGHIRDRILALWADRGRPRDHVVEVFRRRHADPLLREAVYLVAGTSVPPAVRSELLAAWLLASDSPEGDPRMVRGFLLALVETGHVGEAFLALHAFAEHSPALARDPDLAFVWVACLARATRRRDGSWCRKLLASPEALSLIITIRMGRILVTGIAAEWLAMPPEVAAMARTRLLHDDSSTAFVPAAVRDFLGVLERREGGDRALGVAAIAREHEIQVLAARGIYGAWPPASAWEDEFRELVNQTLRDVLEARSGEDAMALIDRLDVGAWIKRTYERLRKLTRTGMPDGHAMKAIERNFADARSVLSELACEMPANGASLQEAMQGARQARAAMNELLAWLDASSPEGGLDASLLADIRSQLDGAMA